MFGDFVDEELENEKPISGETDLEEEDLEEDFEEEYSDEDFEDSGEEVEDDDEDKTAYQILMEDLVEKGVLFADEDKE